jgi:hypothetical protein
MADDARDNLQCRQAHVTCHAHQRAPFLLAVAALGILIGMELIAH